MSEFINCDRCGERTSGYEHWTRPERLFCQDCRDRYVEQTDGETELRENFEGMDRRLIIQLKEDGELETITRESVIEFSDTHGYPTLATDGGDFAEQYILELEGDFSDFPFLEKNGKYFDWASYWDRELRHDFTEVELPDGRNFYFKS